MKVELVMSISEFTQQPSVGFQFVFGDISPSPKPKFTGWNINLFAQLWGQDDYRSCIILVKNAAGYWVELNNQMRSIAVEGQKLVIDHSLLIVKVLPDNTVLVKGFNLPHLRHQFSGCGHAVYDQYKFHISLSKIFNL